MFKRLATLFCIVAMAHAAHAQAPASATPIFFLTTKNMKSAADLPSPQAYDNPAVNGVFIRIAWNAIQPAPDRYDWTLLDQVVKPALAKNKRLSIGLLAAVYSPKWLADKGVPFATYNVKSNTGCHDANIPQLWNDAYLQAYLAAMGALKAHLQQLGAYDALYSVKNSAISINTLELRMPTSTSCSDTVTGQLVASGYRPSTMVAAYATIARGLGSLFPEKLVAQPFLENEPFPAVDEQGQTIPRRKVTTSHDMVATCIRLLGARCAMQNEALGLGPKISQRVLQAKREGATIGWQTNLYEGQRGGAGCAQKHEESPCDEAQYTALLRRGIAEGAAFIEVWEVDVLQFPNAYAAARQP